jgi:hypothetical protein
LPIEHYPQEEEAGCLAACAQIVLADELMLAGDEFDNAYALLTR